MGKILNMYPKSQKEINALVNEGWCDSEYCPEYYECLKQHFHTVNCKCQECYDLEGSI